MKKWFLFLFILLIPSICNAQGFPPLGIQDEGGSISRPVTIIDCTGDGIECSFSVNKATLSVDGGGGSSEWTDAGTFLYPGDLSGKEDVIIGGTALDDADIVLSSTGAAIFNEQSADADFRVESDDNVNMLVVDADVDRVGIGTATPDSTLHVTDPLTTAVLHVEAASGQNSLFQMSADTDARIPFIGFYDSDAATTRIAGIAIDRTSSPLVSGTVQNDLVIFTETGSSQKLHLATEDVTRLTVESGGEVGIGTIGPNAALEINDATGDILRMTYNDGNGGATNYTDFALSSSGDLTITPSGGDVDISGNLGIGIAAPSQPLHIFESSGNSLLEIESDSSGAAGILLDGSQTASTDIYGYVSMFNAGDSVASMQARRDGANDASSLGLYTQATGGGLTERLHIASGGDVSITNDLTITGDDLFMNTNTTAFILVADGTNFNPVAMSGDCLIDSTGLTTCAGASNWTDSGTVLYPGDLSGKEDVIIGGTVAGDADIVLSSTGAAIFNEQGADADFRVESDNLTNALFVDASADSVGIGTSLPSEELTVSDSNNDSVIFIDTHDDGAENSRLWLRKSDTDTIGSFVQTDNGDILGNVFFQGVDTGSNNDFGAVITATQNGASGARVPSKLGLYTYSSTASNTPQLVLGSEGYVAVGTDSPEVLFEVEGAEGADAAIMLDADDGDDATDSWTLESEATGNDFTINNDSTEVLNLTTGGNLQIDGDLTVSGDDLFMTTNTDGAVLVADGTNYNPVVMSGDCTIDSTGAISCNKFEEVPLPVQSAKLSGSFVTDGDATQGAAIDAGDGNWRLLFDATTDEGAVWQFKMPNNYSSAPILEILYTMTSATTNEVEFEGAIMCVSDGDSADVGTASFSTIAVGSATVPGTAGYQDKINITLTDDSCAADDAVWIYLSTDSDDATNDDATGDREVIGVTLSYTGS